MNFLAKFSIAKAIMSIAACGLLSVSVYAGVNFFIEFRSARDTARDVEFATVAGSISAMVHELQKERGASAGFLASKGASFADTLPGQREKSDAAILAFKGSIASMRKHDLQATIVAQLDDVDRQLAALSDLRSDVDAMNIAVLPAVGQITALNRAAINLAPELGKAITHAAAARAVQRHAILMTGKDVIGLERATGAAGLARAHGARSGFPDAVFERLRALELERKTLIGLYKTIASQDIATQIAKADGSAQAQAVETMRAAIDQRAYEAISGISPEAWFQSMTDLLVAFKAMEDAGVQEFRGHLEDAAAKANSNLWNELFAFLAVIAVLGTVSFYFVRTSSRSLFRVSTRIEALAEGDITSPVVQESQADLGMVTRALSQFQAKDLERRAEAERQAQLEQRSADEILKIVDAVEGGTFDQRLELAGLEGPSEVLGSGVNKIMAVTERVVAAQLEADQRLLEEQKAAARAQERTVEDINKIVASFSGGDFSHRIKTDDLEGIWAEVGRGINRIATTCDDALGQVRNLLTSMAAGDISQRMTGDYQGTFGDIRDSANISFEQLQSTFLQIARSVGMIEGAAVEISSGTTDLTQRSEGQARAVVTSLSATKDLEDALEQNNKLLSDCRKLIDQLDTKTSDGQKVTDKAVETISQMESASEEMSKIVATIDEIAFQTNLLALNASVEAARAGEAGKGFAVVASEVRSLSSRCADASRQIGTLINESISQIKTGAGNVRLSGDAMREIHGNMSDLLSMIENMSRSSDTQTEGVRGLGAAMSELDSSAKSNLALATGNSKLTSDLLDLKTQLAAAVAVFQPTPHDPEDAVIAAE